MLFRSVGCIGGSKDPFVQGRAVFTIVDPTIINCKAMGDEEHCPTPWDYCCEPRENLKKNIATIEWYSTCSCAAVSSVCWLVSFSACALCPLRPPAKARIV